MYFQSIKDLLYVHRHKKCESAFERLFNIFIFLYLHVNSKIVNFVLDLIHTRHFGTQYCDKKIILSHMFKRPTKVSSKKHTLNCFVCLFTLIYFILRACLGL
jgi:hypothetical protein